MSTKTTHVVQPPDTNIHGTLFGGTLMGWMDLAAAIEATRRAHGPCVTVAVEKVIFKKPLYVGDIVTIEAKTTSVGHTSLVIGIDVYKDIPLEHIPGMPAIGKTLMVEGEMVFVAVDENGKKRPVN